MPTFSCWPYTAPTINVLLFVDLWYESDDLLITQIKGVKFFQA